MEDTERTSLVRCNNCFNVFPEEAVEYDYDADEEFCPFCKKSGYLMDLDKEDV